MTFLRRDEMPILLLRSCGHIGAKIAVPLFHTVWLVAILKAFELGIGAGVAALIVGGERREGRKA